MTIQKTQLIKNRWNFLIGNFVLCKQNLDQPPLTTFFPSCNHEFRVKAKYNGFFGCPNAHFSRFDKSYYIVPQMKHEKDNKKIQGIKVHYELIP
jgi:hypothetical protein